MRTLLPVLVALHCGWTTPAQTPFQNLNFEAATFPGSPLDMYGRYNISNALPGWTAYAGSTPETLILHNNFFLDTAGIGVTDSTCINPPGFNACRVLSGQFSAFLQAGHQTPIGGPIVDVALAQAGLIPADSRSLRFLSIGLSGGDPTAALHASVAGQPVPIFQLSTGPSFNVYGFDVTAAAGQEAEVRILSSSSIYLDSLVFSTVPVPEPSAVGLAICGAAGLLLAARCSRKKAAGSLANRA